MASATYEKVDEQKNEITAKANSLREQFRPFIEEQSLRKLRNNGKITELANLKFKVTQKYLNLKNRTNITFNNLINKVNNRSKFLDNYVPSNSFLFSNRQVNSNASKRQHSAFSPAILKDSNSAFKNADTIVQTISQENLDPSIQNRLNESDLLIKQISDYRNKLLTIDEILEEMEQVNQEVIIEEDQETVRKDEQMKQVEEEQRQKLDEINFKREKIENDLGQCMELYKSLKMELNAVLHKKNVLKAKANEQKRIYADIYMKFKNLVENDRREMNEIQRKIIERRERDLAIIKAFRIRKIELTKSLEEKEKLVKRNLSTISLNDELEQQSLDEEQTDDVGECDEHNLIEEFDREMISKFKYYKELEKDYQICRKFKINEIKQSDGPRVLKDEKRLEEVEGVVFVNDDFKQLQSENSNLNRFEIGEGYYSTLYKGKSILYKTENKKLIIKKFRFDAKSSSIANEIMKNGFQICSYLSRHPHKNIIEILDLYAIQNPLTNEWNYYQVEEYCLSSLGQFMNDLKDEKFDFDDIKVIADGLANALLYLHSSGIAHLNICPHSIQINESKRVKLGYIESCIIVYSVEENCFKKKNVSINRIMDRRFAAPEVLEKRSNIDLIKADVYSYGLTLAYCFKRKPFNSQNQMVKISEAANSLIENCLVKLPYNRYSMFDVLTHCYFNSRH